MIPLLKRKLSAYRPSELQSDPTIRASVLIPIVVNGADIDILLTKRTTTVKYHKGEISFPGGMYEEDDGETMRTAIRECGEEIGVRPDDIEVMGRLDDLKTVTGFVITPYVGFIPYPYDFALNPDEVRYLVCLPFSYLMTYEPKMERAEHEGKVLHVPAIYYGGERIWGATCRLLLQLRHILEDETI
ncbi:MAG: CoA pyrophosphatase [Syntrophorhabdales bacterium]|jgi:8-oxo-dGTP pyrophosphatase MutT (NUDIX family)